MLTVYVVVCQVTDEMHCMSRIVAVTVCQ